MQMVTSNVPIGAKLTCCTQCLYQHEKAINGFIIAAKIKMTAQHIK